MPEAIRIPPDDVHNRSLLANVHPADWVNPRPKARYHLVVIGAGTAGLVSAAGAAGLGARVALVERHLMGGDCLNVGCVPSKALIRSARAAADVRRAGEFGVDVFLGEGRFQGPDTIAVGGGTLRFRKAVIATGARAVAPPIPGLAEAGFLTNETVFSLTELPARLAVIGAGPLGCELAQAFARFVSKVSLLEAGRGILPREDRDAVARVQPSLLRDGVEILPTCKILKVERRAQEKLIYWECPDSPGRLQVDEILLGAGRAPNVESLNLHAAGVEFDARGGVRVNDRLQTTNARIYAAGDVCSRFKFTHAADAMARIVIRNALFLGRAKANSLTIPWCTYTSPEIAHVGSTNTKRNNGASSWIPSPRNSATWTARSWTARPRGSSRFTSAPAATKSWGPPSWPSTPERSSRS